MHIWNHLDPVLRHGCPANTPAHRNMNTGGLPLERTHHQLSIPEQMQELIDQGMTEKDAMKETARILSIPKREVYSAWKLT